MDKLVKIIKEMPHDQAVDYLTGYVNDVAERVCKNAWRKSNHLLHWVSANRKKQLGDFVIEENPYTNSINAIDLNRLFHAIKDKQVELLGVYPTTEVMEAMEELSDFILSKVERINIDGRSIIPFEKL